MAYISNEEVRKAREELDKITSNGELMDRIFREEMAEFDEIYRRAVAKKKGLEEGMAKGLEEGRAKGLEEGRKKVEKRAEKKKRKKLQLICLRKIWMLTLLQN